MWEIVELKIYSAIEQTIHFLCHYLFFFLEVLIQNSDCIVLLHIRTIVFFSAWKKFLKNQEIIYNKRNPSPIMSKISFVLFFLFSGFLVACTHSGDESLYPEKNDGIKNQGVSGSLGSPLPHPSIPA